MPLAIVRSAFYPELIDEMEGIAMSELINNGIREEDLTISTVPGSFEIPLECKRIIETEKIDGIIAIGIIIQGETHHAEEIARGCTDGIMQVQLEKNIPIIHAVLYVSSLAQAKKRISRAEESAKILIEVLSLRSDAT